jgi:hypothetical protein
MGVMKPADEDAGAVKAWIMPGKGSGQEAAGMWLGACAAEHVMLLGVMMRSEGLGAWKMQAQ